VYAVELTSEKWSDGRKDKTANNENHSPDQEIKNKSHFWFWV
jgi:hypothetical protein